MAPSRRRGIRRRGADHLRFVKVTGGGENVGNVGIVGFEVRRQPERGAPAETDPCRNLYGQSGARAAGAVPWRRQILRAEIDIGADDRRVLIDPFDGALAGRLVAQLDFADDFATDNRAYLAVVETPPLRVLYVGPGNPYLNSLFRFFANIELATLPRWDEARRRCRVSSTW